MWWETYRGVVHPWFCDQFKHMNVRFYLHHFDDAAFHIWSCMGYGLGKMEENGIHTVVANAKIDYIRELTQGEMFYIKSGFVRIGTKSVTYFQKMFHSDTHELHATHEAVEVFFDPKARKATAMPDHIREILEKNVAERDA